MALATERFKLLASHTASNPELDKFAETITPLDIHPQDIGGNVLVVGHGPLFLERKLVCIKGLKESEKESELYVLKPGVRSLTLVDYNHPSDGQDYLRKAEVKYRHPGQRPDLTQGAVNYYQWDLPLALSGVEKPVFDAVTFFRVENMQPLFPEVLEIVHRTLKPGKLFICSGGFQDLSVIPGMFNGGFKIKKAAALPNPDLPGRHYQTAHIGFVLRKRVL